MSFRDNLQHLRATRNMTQEQLAMLLGVSRQSVSKWEAEKSYPEMDKLLKLCDLFDCSLDELIKGDLTTRDPEPELAIAPDSKPTDVCGYDETMLKTGHRIALGVGVILLAIGASGLPDDRALPEPRIVLCVIKEHQRMTVLLQREAGDGGFKIRNNAVLLHRVDQVLFCPNIEIIRHVSAPFHLSEVPPCYPLARTEAPKGLWQSAFRP